MGMRLPPDTLLTFSEHELKKKCINPNYGRGPGRFRRMCDQYRYNREYEYQRKTFETLPCL